MKKVFFIFVLSLFFNCCSQRKVVICNALEGHVLDFKTKEPIENVSIFVNKFATNNFDTIRSNKSGYFFIDGLLLPKKYLHYQSRLSYEYNFVKKGYKNKVLKISDIKQSYQSKLDTIKIENVLLEKE